MCHDWWIIGLIRNCHFFKKRKKKSVYDTENWESCLSSVYYYYYYYLYILIYLQGWTVQREMEVAVVGGSTRQILGVYPGKCMELRWVSRNIRSKAKGDKEKRVSVKNKKEKVPIYISTNPSHINSEELRDLYSACNHSCHRFPKYLDCDTDVVEAVDIHKLRTALSHSSLVVSVFCKPTDVLLFTTKSSSEINTTSNENIQIQIQGLGLGLKDLFQQLMPVTPFNAQLVGFGRAVSDFGLTASIYDVMVYVYPHPPHSTLSISTVSYHLLCQYLFNNLHILPSSLNYCSLVLLCGVRVRVRVRVWQIAFQTFLWWRMPFLNCPILLLMEFF